MIDGVINVYKEEGFTSHDVVAKLRGILHQKKIGHTGTLDPDAVGVLPVCLGKGTRLCDMLTDATKTYETWMRLGVVTDTQDMSGKVLEEHPVTVSEEEIRRAASEFTGDVMQIPPMYSALKVNGKRLYQLAREGIEVERKPRPVTFHEIEVLDVNIPLVHIRITCSKGTYIRTFCHDMGQKLGCGAAMEQLTRTRVGDFSIKDSLKLEEIEKLVHEEKMTECIIPVAQMFSDCPRLDSTAMGDLLLHNGNPLAQELVEGTFAESWMRTYDSQGRFIGIYQWKDRSEKYYPVKMFYSPDE